MTRIRTTLVAVAGAALAASMASPATADSAVIGDKAGDLKGGFDIRSVTVDNNGGWITASSKHRNLKYGPKAPGGGISLFIDTIPKRKGPEFRFGGPVGFDGDYALVKMRNWKAVGDPLNCQLRYGVNYKRDVVNYGVTRRCLDRAFDHRVGAIRVAIKAAQSTKHGQPKVDWLPSAGHLSAPVLR